MKANNKGLSNFCKMVLNSSYGFDGLNESHFTKTKFCNYSEAIMEQGRPNFLGTRQINEDLYLVTYRPDTYSCKTCIQCNYFTLDNAKFAYVAFVYLFMHKCLDMNKIHFIEGDTDSSYWAVAGDPTKSVHQGFSAVVKEKGFWHQHYYEWFPDPTKGIEDQKKLGGLCVENEGNEMIAIAPKDYYIRMATNKNGVSKESNKLKGKGVSQRNYVNPKVERIEEPTIQVESYRQNILEEKTVNGKNMGFHSKKDKLVKDVVNKIAISGVHTKMIVLANNCCAPYIHGLTANDYVVS
jgi:hypothetical protein